MFGTEGVYWIRNKLLSTKFIDGSGPYVHGTERPSLPIGLFSPRLIPTQVWLVEKVQNGESFVIRNFDTGNVLDIENQSADEGKLIVLTPYRDVGDRPSTQHWNIAWDSDDNKVPFYRVTNQKIGTVLDQTGVKPGGAVHTIVSWKLHTGEHQRWSFEPVIFPTMYWIMNVRTDSENVLQWVEPDASNAAFLNAKTRHPDRSQLWYLEETQDNENYYTIRNVAHEDKVLDLSGADSTTILAYTATGTENQRWTLTDVNFNGIVNVICARNNTVLYAQSQQGRFIPCGATEPKIFVETCNWRLVPCPIPSLFWTTLQSKSSGKFVAQGADGSISSVDGAWGERDHTAQWRFKRQDHNAFFVITNRKTGDFLCNPSSTSITADYGPINAMYSWMLDAGGSDISITNLSSSSVLSFVNGAIQVRSGEKSDTACHWIISPNVASVPSFAIVNGWTGMSLAFDPNAPYGSVTTVSTINSYRSQWIFQQVGVDEDNRPTYVITNKLSNTVLDQWSDTHVGALNEDSAGDHPRRKWTILPCRKKYFAIMNVGTRNYIYDNSPPNELTIYNPNPGEMTEIERRSSWTFVSCRDHSGVDTISIDPDISQPSRRSPYVVERSRGNKGKGKTKCNVDHIPMNSRIRRVDESVILNITQNLINEWLEDQLPTNTGARRYASTSRRGAKERWNILIPPALVLGSDQDGWIRIDIQGAYKECSGVRVANVQGQWGTNTIFHVTIPVGVYIGHDIIREAMRRSLRESVSVRLDIPDKAMQRGVSRTELAAVSAPAFPAVPPTGQFWIGAGGSRTAVIPYGLLAL